MDYIVQGRKFQEELLYEHYPKLKGFPLVGPVNDGNIVYDEVYFTVYIGETSFISVQLYGGANYNCFNSIIDNPIELLRFLVSTGAMIHCNNENVTKEFREKL